MPPHAARRAWHIRDPHPHVIATVYCKGTGGITTRSVTGLLEDGQIEQLIPDGRGVAGAGLQNSSSMRSTPIDINAGPATPAIDQQLWEWKQDVASPLGDWPRSWAINRSLKLYSQLYRSDWAGTLTLSANQDALPGISLWIVMGGPPGTPALGGLGGGLAVPASTPTTPPSPGQSGSAPGQQDKTKTPPGQEKKTP